MKLWRTRFTRHQITVAGDDAIPVLDPKDFWLLRIGWGYGFRRHASALLTSGKKHAQQDWETEPRKSSHLHSLFVSTRVWSLCSIAKIASSERPDCRAYNREHATTGDFDPQRSGGDWTLFSGDKGERDVRFLEWSGASATGRDDGGRRYS